MSQIWMEGWDQYGGDIDTILDGVWAAIEGTGSGDITLSNAQARTGDYSLRVNANSSTSNTTNAVRRVFPSALSEVFVSFGIFMPELPVNNTRFGPVNLRDNGNSEIMTIAVTSTGQLMAVRGGLTGGTLLSTTTGPVLSAGTWHHVEVRVVRDASSGIVEIRVDEVEVMNITGQDTGANDFSQLAINGKNTDASNPDGAVFYIDDLIVRDATGSYNNNFQGDLRVATLQPVANAAAQGWAVQSIQKLGDGVLDATGGAAFNEGIAYDDDAALEIGSGDFCLETFVRWSQLQSGTDIEQIIGKWREDNDTRSYRLFRKGPDDGSMITFETSSDGTLGDVVSVIEYPFVPIVKRWYHIAVSRDSGTLRLFINGVQVGVDTAESRTYYDGTAQVMINGRQSNSSDSIVADTAVEGWLDATRITIGAARYTANFTPPSTSPVNDVDTALLLNYEDASNTDESSNAFVGTLINAAPVFPDDALAYQTIDGLSPNDDDFISADLVAAVGTLTFTANPLDTETVVLGATTYTFQTSLTDSANNVLIGADADESLNNLIAAVNLEAGAGTLYGTGTVANASASLSALPGDQVLATAKTAGAAGNSIASTTTVTGGSWGDTTLDGGADIPGVSEFDLSALPAEVTGIKAIALVGRNFKLDSGSSEMRMSLKTAAGAVADGTTRPVTLTPTYYEDTIEEDPNTMGALTTTTINGAQMRFGRIS